MSSTTTTTSAAAPTTSSSTIPIQHSLAQIPPYSEVGGDSVEEATRLSVMSGAIGLLAASYQTFYDLEDINYDPIGKTECINAALRSLKWLKLSCQLLLKQLRRVETSASEIPERLVLIQVESLVVILSETIMSVSVLYSTLLDSVRRAAETCTRVSDVVQDNAPDIKAVIQRITNSDWLISQLIHVLKGSDDNQAADAAAIASKAASKIIDQNSVLFNHMRSLDPNFRLPIAMDSSINSPPPPTYIQSSSTTTISSHSTTEVNDNLPAYTQSAPNSTSRFLSGITLNNVNVLSLVPLPLFIHEVQYSQFYESEYIQSVQLEIDQLMEDTTRSKSASVPRTLQLRPFAVPFNDPENFARRVGREYNRDLSKGGKFRAKTR